MCIDGAADVISPVPERIETPAQAGAAFGLAAPSGT